MRAPFPKTGYGRGQCMAEGGVVAPNSDPDISRIENAMRSAGEQEQYERGPNRVVPLVKDDSSPVGTRDNSMADTAHQRMQLLAELAMAMRKAKPHADGAVIAPQSQQPSTLDKFLSFIMGPRKALNAASNPNAQPTPPPDTDISIVRRAAEEAGRRNDAEQAAKSQANQSKSQFGGYGK